MIFYFHHFSHYFKGLLLSLTLLLTLPGSYGQVSMLEDKEMHDIIIKGLDKTYNFEFDEARKIYAQVKQKYPDHPAYNFLLASSLYWEMLYYDNYKEKSGEYFNYLTEANRQAEKFLHKNHMDVEGVFFSMGVASSFALYYSERDETMKCLNHAKKAYALMKDGFSLKDKYADFYFSTGLYDYYVVQYPETHPVFKPFMVFFANGNKSRGISELEHASRNSIFCRTESLHYLTNIFLKYENHPEKATPFSEQLVKKYPDNIYFITRHVEGLIATGRYKEAEGLSYKLYKTGKKPFIMRSYVFYGMLNEFYYKKPDEAINYYQWAIKLAKELTQPVGDWLAYSYAGLGRVYMAKGDKNKAVECYKLALEHAEYTGVRKESEDFLKKYD